VSVLQPVFSAKASRSLVPVSALLPSTGDSSFVTDLRVTGDDQIIDAEIVDDNGFELPLNPVNMPVHLNDPFLSPHPTAYKSLSGFQNKQKGLFLDFKL